MLTYIHVFCQAAGASRHSTQDELPTVTPYERKKICTLCNVQVYTKIFQYKVVTDSIVNPHANSKIGSTPDFIVLNL